MKNNKTVESCSQFLHVIVVHLITVLHLIEVNTLANGGGFEVCHSSPTYQRSNGEIERAVQTLKRLLKKKKKKGERKRRKKKKSIVSLSMYTSIGWLFSAELLMGRKSRTTIPRIVHEQLIPKWPDLVKLQEREAR